MNPSEDLLATVRSELDLDLEDAPDDSDERGPGKEGSREGATTSPVKKCRPWHWLQDMRYVILKACKWGPNLAMILFHQEEHNRSSFLLWQQYDADL